MQKKTVSKVVFEMSGEERDNLSEALDIMFEREYAIADLESDFKSLYDTLLEFYRVI